MMKSIYIASRTALLIIITAILGACTRNDGNIGQLFGMWRMVEATEAGQPLELPADTYYVWSFQNNITQIKEMHTNLTYNEYWCTFSDTSFDITLNFNHSDDENNAGFWPYMTPDQLGFAPAPCTVTLRKLEFKPRTMHLEYVNPDNGTTYTYTLNKIY